MRRAFSACSKCYVSRRDFFQASHPAAWMQNHLSGVIVGPLVIYLVAQAEKLRLSKVRQCVCLHQTAQGIGHQLLPSIRGLMFGSDAGQENRARATVMANLRV